MKILFLGHRPQDLGGFEKNSLQEAISEQIYKIIKELTPHDVVLTSLGLGIETWAAQHCNYFNDPQDFKDRPYHVYIPFKDPHSKWPFASRKLYTALLNGASKKISLDDGPYDISKVIAKDVAMCQEADTIYTFFKDYPKFLNKFSSKIVNSMPKETSDEFFISL